MSAPVRSLMPLPAHKRAWENANILHRDVSVGNIMINCETGKGFLNDWDLCKYREDMVVKRPASEPSGISVSPAHFFHHIPLDLGVVS